jgi:hypothetical protein
MSHLCVTFKPFGVLRVTSLPLRCSPSNRLLANNVLKRLVGYHAGTYCSGARICTENADLFIRYRTKRYKHHFVLIGQIMQPTPGDQ